jgi:tetratricopeptide (TPR) repeat protein
MNLEEMSRSVVRIEGETSFGTGFFFLKHYCLTCHHVIWPLSKIYVCRGGTEFRAEWVKEYSIPGQDIAVLRVKQREFPAVELGVSLFTGRRVSVWGFTQETKDKLTLGFQISGKLSDAHTFYEANREEPMGREPWNTKPKVKVKVIGLSCDRAGIGLSGAPVWDSKEGKVVGMFHSVQRPNPKRNISTFGYVIPIEVLPTERPHIRSLQFDESGIESLRVGRFEPSLDFFDKSLEISPDNDQVWVHKAVGLLRIARIHSAQDCLDRARNINARNYHQWLLQGLLLLRRKEMLPASECFQIAKIGAEIAGRQLSRLETESRLQIVKERFLEDGLVKRGAKGFRWRWNDSESRTRMGKGSSWSFARGVEYWEEFWDEALRDDRATEYMRDFAMNKVIQQETEWWRLRLSAISVFYGMSPEEISTIIRMTRHEVMKKSGIKAFHVKLRFGDGSWL